MGLYISGEDCKIQWTNLRKNFREKLMKHKQLPSGSGAKKTSHEGWPWWTSMQFVANCVEPNKSVQ